MHAHAYYDVQLLYYPMGILFLWLHGPAKMTTSKMACCLYVCNVQLLFHGQMSLPKMSTCKIACFVLVCSPIILWKMSLTAWLDFALLNCGLCMPMFKMESIFPQSQANRYGSRST